MTRHAHAPRAQSEYEKWKAEYRTNENWKLYPCVMYAGHIRENGYGRTSDHRVAHRVAWEMWRGPIPRGLVIDHLCRNRACINPNHMEPVTRLENVRRGVGISVQCGSRTHCICGKEYDRISAQGHRHCRSCDAKRARHYRAVKKQLGEPT